MRCDESDDLIDLYLDEALSEEARGRVERHLLRCPECAFRARAIEQILGLLQEACPPVEASPSFRERIAARLQDEFQDVIRPEPADVILQRSFSFPA